MDISLPKRCFNVKSVLSVSGCSCRLKLGVRQGSGEALVYQLSPAVLISYFDFRGKAYQLNPSRRDHIWEINYGLQGCLEHELNNGCFQYIGKGDLSFNMESAHTAEMLLPMGFYKGVGIVIDIQNQAALARDFPGAAGIDLHQMAARFQAYGNNFLIQLGAGVQEFYHVPDFLSEEDRARWLSMKVAALLFYLDRCPWTAVEQKNIYARQQVEIIKEIHEELIRNLDARISIEEIARRHYISSTKLKTMFKDIYGKPIGAYMKDYRIRKAAQQLQGTKVNIGELGRNLGYQSTSKFCNAFKEIMGCTPSAYRRQHGQDGF